MIKIKLNYLNADTALLLNNVCGCLIFSFNKSNNINCDFPGIVRWLLAIFSIKKHDACLYSSPPFPRYRRALSIFGIRLIISVMSSSV